jgi:hypothetical protein
MVLTKGNTKSLLGKIMHHEMPEYKIDVYYYFPKQKIKFSRGREITAQGTQGKKFMSVELSTIQIERSPKKLYKVELNTVALAIGDEIHIVKSVPPIVEHNAIKGIFYIGEWGDED